MPSRRTESSYPMVEVADALKLIRERVQLELDGSERPDRTEGIALRHALGRVLSEDQVAAAPFPALPLSTKDGYAVVSGDEAGVERKVLAGQASFAGPVVDEGATHQHQAGSVVYVTTGAPVPRGADAVVMIEDVTEHVEADGGGEEVPVRVTVHKQPAPGENIRPVGSDVKQGEVVLKKGAVIGASEMGLLATIGCLRVQVHCRLRVGVCSTGDEVVDSMAEDPQLQREGQVYDSNRPLLLSMLRAAPLSGLVEVRDLGVVPDTEEHISTLVDSCHGQALDVLITSGGVSMGKKDFVKPAIAAAGEVVFGRVRMKPGKPTTFGLVREVKNSATHKPVFVFGLPGNPVSCLACFHVFVAPCLRQLGRLPHFQASTIQVALSADVRVDRKRMEYHRAVLEWNDLERRYYAYSTGDQSSSRLLSFRSANALLEIPSDDQGVTLRKGSFVRALLLSDAGAWNSPKPSSSVSPSGGFASTCCGGHHHDHDHGTSTTNSHVHHTHNNKTLLDTKTSPAASSTTSFTTATTASASVPTVAVAALPPAVEIKAYPPHSTDTGASFSFSVGILTVSDRCSRGETTDLTGPKMDQFFSQDCANAVVKAYAVVSDDREDIEAALRVMCKQVDLVVTNGGTGFAARDVTPEATKAVCDRDAESIATEIGRIGRKHTPMAILSRGYCGVRRATLVLNMPGSTKAVYQVLPELFATKPSPLMHALKQLQE
jgi:gephyrin